MLEFQPVTQTRLADLARFSEGHGKFRYCSCMRWRMTTAAFQRMAKEQRVAALEDVVRRDTPVGVLAYLRGEPVGWCSVAPRETYAALERYCKSMAGEIVCWTPYGGALIKLRAIDGDERIFCVPLPYMHRVRRRGAWVRVTYRPVSERVLDVANVEEPVEAVPLDGPKRT